MTPAKLIMEILVRTKVIESNYSGQVVLHIGQGGLCDVERRPVFASKRGLKSLLEGPDLKKDLTF